MLAKINSMKLLKKLIQYNPISIIHYKVSQNTKSCVIIFIFIVFPRCESDLK